jgi:copper chaperone CopZ
MNTKLKNLNALLLSAGLAVSVQAFAEPKTIQIGLDGLVCAFCAQGVEKKMKAQAATDKVFVSLDKKVALVALKDGQDIPDATIKSEITEAGYVVKGITRSEESFDALRKKIKDSK